MGGAGASLGTPSAAGDLDFDFLFDGDFDGDEDKELSLFRRDLRLLPELLRLFLRRECGEEDELELLGLLRLWLKILKLEDILKSMHECQGLE
jgi:hypothetical protein